MSGEEKVVNLGDPELDVLHNESEGGRLARALVPLRDPRHCTAMIRFQDGESREEIWD